jgi:hypothetical protein
MSEHVLNSTPLTDSPTPDGSSISQSNMSSSSKGKGSHTTVSPPADILQGGGDLRTSDLPSPSEPSEEQIEAAVNLALNDASRTIDAPGVMVATTDGIDPQDRYSVALKTAETGIREAVRQIRQIALGPTDVRKVYVTGKEKDGSDRALEIVAFNSIVSLMTRIEQDGVVSVMVYVSTRHNYGPGDYHFSESKWHGTYALNKQGFVQGEQAAREVAGLLVY